VSLLASSLYPTSSVWCGIIGGQLIVPYIFRVVWHHWWSAHCTLYLPASSDRLYLRHELPTYFCKHNASYNTSMTEHPLISGRTSGSMWISNSKINWIGRDGVLNLPPRSPNLSPLHYLVWDYMKAMLQAHKVNTKTAELLQWILSAARNSQ
jgi:hypothetical protein